jgi:hypothetical protein
VTPWEIAVDVLQWVAIGGLSYALIQARQAVTASMQASQYRAAASREQTERLYTTTNRRLGEHIQSRMH